GQPVLNKEELVINENGHQRWLLTSKLPLKDESGNITGIVGIGRDITERKQAEEALQQSHERFQLANLATFNAIWDWNLQTDALWWNENFQALFGYRAEEIEPGIESWTNRIHPEDVDRIKTGIHSAIDSGQQSWSGHYRFRRKDGSYAEVEDRGYISREANGKPVRMIGAMQDITERKQAEEALRESESSLQAILRSTADGFLAVDRENRVLLANGRFEEMWKIPQEVMTSKDDSVLLQYILDQLIDPQGFLQKVQQLYKSDEDSFDTLFFKDGRIFERLSRPLMAGTELRGRVWSFRDITERKRAEDALRESEQRFDDIIDFLPDATFAINLKGEVIAWNRALEELTGAAKEELIGKGAFAYAVPFYGKTGPMLIDLIFQDREEMKKNYDYLIKRRDQVVAEAFVPALRGGKGAYLWGIASPLYDSSGAIVGSIVSLRDITERKRAEGEQRTAEANYRNLFERVPSGLYRSTPEGRFLEVNQAMVDLFGYSSVQEMMTLDIGSAFYHSAEERDQWVKKLLQTGELRNTENHSLRKDGNSMVLLENSRVVRDESGKVLFFEGTLTDTTDRKRAEEASRKSEEKYRLLIENSHDIIYTLTPDGVFTFVSPGWTALLGHPVIEVVGKPFQQFVHPDDLERCRVFLQKTIETGQRQMGIEYRTQHADGSWRWHTSNGVPLKDETGKVVSYEGIASDITERKQIEGEMEKTRANFLFGVSHELKTPLFLMDISLEMLENSPESGRAKRTSEFMETWKRNLHRLRHLVFNMVDSQRTQTMGFKIERQSTDFRALIERVVQEHELLAGPKKIRITMDLAPIPPMFIDPEAIHRLVENLLTNAIKFSPRSGEVTIRLVEEDAKAVLTVKDQGSGISAEEQKGLFLPFQRAATAVRSVIPGTGLGLYVAKIIVDAHGGTISLRSKVGKGTTVTARLPLGELGK
ncbi:MAG: PAS domain S-box protein, partial [Coprothermobacterota bacterium]|nr:PAS domain S-box protein [Coprothermobacterota bacterium]